MQTTSKSQKAEAKAKAEAEVEVQKINCPVIGCRRNLTLQPHPTLPARLIALCNCNCPRRGLSVYETDASRSEPATKAESS